MHVFTKLDRLVGLTVLALFVLLAGGGLFGLRLLVPGQTHLEAVPVAMAEPVASGSEPVAPPSEQPKKIRIVIDPGHGGKDPGAVGDDESMEKDYTLSIALRVFELLEREPLFEPRLTREADEFVELEQRADLANAWEADALISIHANTYKHPSVGGTETYYLYDHSLPLANSIHRHLVEGMGFRDREIRQLHWKVLRFSHMPAVLVEIGYLTNPDEAAAMLSDEGRTRAAQAIVNGFKHHYAERLDAAETEPLDAGRPDVEAGADEPGVSSDSGE